MNGYASIIFRMTAGKPQRNLLTAVIPVTDVVKRWNLIELWLADAKADGLEIVFVLDSPSEEESHYFRNQMRLKELKNFSILEGVFGSPGAARNAGLQNLTTEYVTFWDCDDIPLIDNILSDLENITSEPRVIIGNYEIFRYRENEIELLEQPQIPFSLKEILSSSPGIWRFIFPTAFVQKIEFSNLKMGEDQLFLIELGMTDNDVLFSTKVYYRYILHDFVRLTNTRDAFDDIVPLIKSLEERKSKCTSAYELETIQKVILKLTFSGIKHGKLSIKKNLIIQMSKILKSKKDLKILIALFQNKLNTGNKG